MKIRLLSLLSLFFVSRLALNAQSLSVVDTIWGTPVADPYRWLEDLNSDTVKAWLKQQQKITWAEKRKFDGSFMNIGSKLEHHGSVYIPDFGGKQGEFYFQFEYQSEISTPVLYYKRRINGSWHEAYNTHDFGKEPLSIKKFVLSNDTKYLAVALSKAGTDWEVIKVRDLKKKKDLPDKVEWVKFSNIIWTDSGFFYCRYKETPIDSIHVAPNSKQELCFHKLGDLQQQDRVIYSIPDIANPIFYFEITSNRQYLILHSITKLNGKLCKAVSYKDLNGGIYAPINLLITSPLENNVNFDVIDCINDKFIIRTNLNAPHYRVLSCHKDSMNRVEEFIPEYKEILKSVQHIGNKLLCLYFNKGSYTGSIINYDGKMPFAIKFQEGVNIGGFYKESDTVASYYQNSFYTPAVAYTLNLNTNKTELIDSTQVTYNPHNYTTKIVIYESKDGTKVPMYLTYKKDYRRSGNSPVLLQSSGGAGVLSTPFYSYSNLLLFENGGILAVPMIRGGGEFGENWHKQGKGLNKQNSFDDFASAAKYLIDIGYTDRNHLAISSRSYGGLLIGAMITQHPNLFKVAIGDVGLYDMIRFHLYTIGRFIEDEYGTSNDSIQFHNLLKYSPVHNVKPYTDYPATLLLTGENDDRFPPFHTYKFLAALQDNTFGKEPHILWLSKDSGHNGPETLNDWYRKKALIFAFLFNQLGIERPNFDF